ncbi:glycosyltransferase [Opitutaceae bacterium TAV4]|nr:glycosyltransferase [Opitutaceae bacterium TAV4]RRJ94489.1 glycosyltransferase [Opitutaceae bacterium TAV4]RRJ98550.1 glycosyltransferase [Opitutaceae bacterium TAV3]
MSHILLIVEPGMDGVFRHTEGLADYLLSKQEVAVGLAYSSVRSSDALWALVERIGVAGGPVLDMQIGNAPAGRDFSAVGRLAALIVRFKPDVIHAHSSKGGALARLLWYAGLSAPLFYTPNAYFGLNRVDSAKTKVFNAIETVLGRIGRTINVSASERRFARGRLGLPASSLLAVPNAVDCERFRPASSADRAMHRRVWGIPQDAWVLGTVGRYSEQKDPETLYRAVERVLAVEPDAWFAHLGQGEQYDAITGMVAGKPWANRVVRVRYSATPAEFYRALDVFVLSSRYEGLPISGLEALAAGLPLVFTRCPGCEDFEALGLNAVRWAPVSDFQALSAAILSMKREARGGNNHREIALRKLTPKVVYGDILAAYRAALHERLGVVI